MAVFATYTTRNDDDAPGNSSAQTKMGQPFTVTGSCTVSTADIYYLGKNGSPTGNLTVQICADSAGSPGTVLQTGTSINEATLPARGTAGPQTSTFSGVALSSGTTYWLVITPAAIDSSNFLWWGIGNTTPPYSNYKLYNGSAWSNGATTYNADFVINGTAAASGPANVKTWDGVTQSTGIKTYEGVALSSVKSVTGIN